MDKLAPHIESRWDWAALLAGAVAGLLVFSFTRMLPFLLATGTGAVAGFAVRKTWLAIMERSSLLERASRFRKLVHNTPGNKTLLRDIDRALSVYRARLMVPAEFEKLLNELTGRYCHRSDTKAQG